MNSKSIISILKFELRRQNVSYKQLGTALAISESAVKKMFANENFSLKRLDSICKFLEVDLLELMQREHKPVKIKKMTLQQEQIIAKNRTWLVILYCATNYWSIEDITHRYKFTKAEIITCLVELEKFGLIELKPDNKIIPLLDTNFEWHTSGPINNIFREQFLNDFFQSDFKGNDEIQIVKNGDLSEESQKRLRKKIKQLAELYDELCYNDRNLKSSTYERKGYSMIVASRKWALDRFSEHRR